MDEFFTCDSATSPCARNLDIMTKTCVDLGFTLNPSKFVHPSTCLTLLGIEIDSIRQETRIEASRLNDTLALLAAWEGRTHCTKRQLQSLLGTLDFICNVCRPVALSCVVSSIFSASPALRDTTYVSPVRANRTSVGGLPSFLSGMASRSSTMISGPPTYLVTCSLTPANTPLARSLMVPGSVVRLMHAGSLFAFLLPSKNCTPSRPHSLHGPSLCVGNA